jgi:hypothetical protein
VNLKAVIHFDADRLFAGICYHLSQPWQRHCKYFDLITPDSILHLRQRLTREQPKLSILKWDWDHYSDVERFDWLMKAANTEVVAVLPVNTEDKISVGELRKVNRPLLSKKTAGN